LGTHNIGARDRPAANSAFDKRPGFSSDMAGPRSMDHVAGSGEQAFQKRDEYRGGDAANT
jgi:hypothetical protein